MAQPPPLTMTAQRLSVLSRRYGLQLRGTDLDVSNIAAIETASGAPTVAFAWTGDWLRRAGAAVAAVIVTPEVADQAADTSLSLLVTDRDPQAVFYEMFYDTAVEGLWTLIPSAIGAGTQIADSAHIGENVRIGAGCHIMPGAVLLPNTWLGDGVTIKPCAVLGGDGFQVRQIRGQSMVLPHVGGVYVADRASVGSSTCVDRGLFGEYTTIHEDAHLDNLIHLAHSAVVGPGAAVIACAEVSGSVVLGRGCWIGPNAAINQSLKLGDYCYIGTGSVVNRDIPAYAMAFGNPAKQRAWVCSCKAKLPVTEASASATCEGCGQEFVVVDGAVQPA